MLKIVDDFYDDPDAIREMAIHSKYDLISSGNYIGRDTVNRNVLFPELERRVREFFPEDHCKIVCSRFRTAIEGDTHMAFVHADSTEIGVGWHVLVYLSKDEVEDGITFYRHVTQGVACEKIDISSWTDTENFEKFIPIQTVPYKYNRAVILDYAYFHSPMHHSGFGEDITTSRLMHIVEVCDVRSSHYKNRISRPGACVPANNEPN